MKDPMRLVERFCARHPNFGIPNLMRYIAIGSGIFWIVGLINPVLLSYMAFSPYAIFHGQIWRLVTFLLYPPNTGFLALIAVYFYYWIGTSLENAWGTGPFTVYFFSGAILTALFGILFYLVTGVSVSLTAEYIYLGMFFAFAVLFPDMEILLFFILPVKIKYLAILDAVFFVLSIFSNPFPLNLLPVVAMLNFLVFCGGELWRIVSFRHPKANTIHFRRESARIRREQQSKLFTHKCSVCGRTDVSNPELEFRYCSKCAGYHCFCQEHINNHIHFTE